MASLTHWLRLEPLPRSSDIGGSLAAEIRDPLWFLTRQWQLGETDGTDTGSIAYVEYSGRASTIPRAIIDDEVRTLDGGAPLEPQALAEPFEPDLALRVELAQDFEDRLFDRFPDEATLDRLVSGFFDLERFRLSDLADDQELNPVDPATKRFLSVCVGRSLDGYELYLLGIGLLDGTETVPPEVTTDATEVEGVRQALDALVGRVEKVFGKIGTHDPETWQPARLEYGVQAVAVDPGGEGNRTLQAHPDAQGQYDWSSFDAVARDAAAVEEPPEPLAFTMVPTDVRFPGMPNPRFWMFEENELSFVNLEPNKRDLMKLLTADFALIHGANWYSLPIEQEVGTLVRTDSLVVTDVFGHRTLVERADRNAAAPGTDRWTMFSITDTSDTTETLADYFVLAPSAGPAMELGAVLEDVRFARDEMANMAWAVERVTASPIGQPRSGSQRDAEIAARQNLPMPEPTGSAPLRYQIESRVPANWIPLLGVQPEPNDPSIVLEKAAALLPRSDGTPAIVPSLGKILSPTSVTPPYRFFEEEVPRSGARIERIVYRTRWLDGSTHLWAQRRRLAGAGESQSNLRFDQALPNESQGG